MSTRIIDEILMKLNRHRMHEVMEGRSAEPAKRTILVTNETYRDILSDPMIRRCTPLRGDWPKELGGHELIIAELPQCERFRIVREGFKKEPFSLFPKPGKFKPTTDRPTNKGE